MLGYVYIAIGLLNMTRHVNMLDTLYPQAGKTAVSNLMWTFVESSRELSLAGTNVLHHSAAPNARNGYDGPASVDDHPGASGRGRGGEARGRAGGTNGGVQNEPKTVITKMCKLDWESMKIDGYISNSIEMN